MDTKLVVEPGLVRAGSQLGEGFKEMTYEIPGYQETRLDRERTPWFEGNYST